MSKLSQSHQTMHDNALIAQYDGWRRSPGDGQVWYRDHIRRRIYATSFKYHTSWDVLMPVWTKIVKQMSTTYPQQENIHYNEAKHYLMIGSLRPFHKNISLLVNQLNNENRERTTGDQGNP